MVDVERVLRENAQLKLRLTRLEDLEAELCAVREERDIFRKDLARNRLHVARLTNLVEAKDTKLKDAERQLEWISKQKQQARSQRENSRTPHVRYQSTSRDLERSTTTSTMEGPSKVYTSRPKKRALGTVNQNMASDIRPEKRIKVETPEVRPIIKREDRADISKLSWDHEDNNPAPSLVSSAGSPSGHDGDKSSSEEEILPPGENHTVKQATYGMSSLPPPLPTDESALPREASLDSAPHVPKVHIRQRSPSAASLAESARTENTIMPATKTVPLAQSKITQWTSGTRPISPPPSVAETLSQPEASPPKAADTKPRTDFKQETQGQSSKSKTPKPSRRRVAKSLFERPPNAPKLILPDEDVLAIVRRAAAVPAIDPAPSELLVSRQLVTQWYGQAGDDGAFMESSRLGPFLFISPENSPSLPQKPGDPATIIISGKTPTNPLVTLFFCVGTDDRWMLAGMYRLSTRKMLPDEFKMQSKEANFAHDILKGKSLPLASGSLNPEFTTPDEVVHAFESGDETLFFGTLTFFMYSHAFARDTESRFQRTHTTDAAS